MTASTEREGLRDLAERLALRARAEKAAAAAQATYQLEGLLDLRDAFEDFGRQETERAKRGAGPASNEGGGSTPESLAKRFHELYEYLAPKFDYETRKASSVPWEQVPENNRKLMTTVCEHILKEMEVYAARAALAGKDQPPAHSLYASYANHEAIAKRVPMTFHSWKREQGKLKAEQADVSASEDRFERICDDCGHAYRGKEHECPPAAPARHHLREHIFPNGSNHYMSPLAQWDAVGGAWRCKCGVALGSDNLFEAWMQHVEGR